MKKMPADDAPLSREEFMELALSRFGGVCCACRQAPATEAHHIFDRKLFADGGYALSNAAPVCNRCHWKAETCAISVSEMARMAKANPRVPQACRSFFPGLGDLGPEAFDKWGNMLRHDGSIAPGPLFSDDGCRKALASGGLLGLCYNA